jgi:uncharacterized protein (DUF2336 family)
MSGAPKLKETALHELKTLAHERDHGARQTLFEKVCDLALAGGGEIEPQIQKLMDDILLGLVRNVEQRIRARLAERLAPLKSAPPELLRLLAKDDINIARPILTRSPQLLEEDLIAIIGSASKDHAVAIARRPRLAERVGDVLIESGDIQIFEALAENQTAKLSRGALGALAVRSEAHEPLQKMLLSRKDLPPEFAHQMFWWVSATLRRFILERFDIDQAALDRMIFEIAEENAPGAGRKALKTGLNVANLIINLRTDKAADFRRDLAGLVGVSEETARRIINDPGGEALAVACRAMGADRSQFTTLLLLLDYKRFGRPRPTGHLEQVALAYDRMPRDRAVMTARLWDLLSPQRPA